ncbi:MAG: HAD-IIB family hydrolase [Candidatus Kerfeldbacteria bacterium]|nr:HAD-IIB family hydrolase [Candidatus Kerfeldbacteria bacterium]
MNQPLYLLASDLDCTVLPNGVEPLSPGAMELFTNFVQRPQVHLAYVSGRDLGLIQKALTEYHVPLAHTIISDVGTTIYSCRDHSFVIDEAWSNQIGVDWKGYTGPDIASWLKQFSQLTLQPPAKQNRFKLSYFTPVEIDHVTLINQIQQILRQHTIAAAVIFSIDQVVKTGLLDILPASATKRQAVDYLIKKLNITTDQVVYAGDSGNDLEPLTSGYKAIVVNNAAPAVKDEIKQLAQTKGVLDKIYFAQGGYQGMNGNYVAGIVEGLQHFGWL